MKNNYEVKELKESDMNILLRTEDDCYEVDSNGQVRFTFCEDRDEE